MLEADAEAKILAPWIGDAEILAWRPRPEGRGRGHKFDLAAESRPKAGEAKNFDFEAEADAISSKPRPKFCSRGQTKLLLSGRTNDPGSLVTPTVMNRLQKCIGRLQHKRIGLQCN